MPRTSQAAISEQDEALWTRARLRCQAVQDPKCLKKFKDRRFGGRDEVSIAAGDLLCNVKTELPHRRNSPFVKTIYDTDKCESITRERITRAQGDNTEKEWLNEKATKDMFFEEWPSEWEMPNEDVADTTACCEERSEPKTYDMLIKASETCEAVEGACLSRQKEQEFYGGWTGPQAKDVVEPAGERLCGNVSGNKGDGSIFNDPFLQKIVEDGYSCGSITRGMIKEEIKNSVSLKNPGSFRSPEYLYPEKYYFLQDRFGTSKYDEESFWESQVEDDNTKCCKETTNKPKPKTPRPAPAALPQSQLPAPAPAPMTQVPALPKPACEFVRNACMVARHVPVIPENTQANYRSMRREGEGLTDAKKVEEAGRHFCNLKADVLDKDHSFLSDSTNNPAFIRYEGAIANEGCKGIDLAFIRTMADGDKLQLGLPADWQSVAIAARESDAQDIKNTEQCCRSTSQPVEGGQQQRQQQPQPQQQPLQPQLPELQAEQAPGAPNAQELQQPSAPEQQTTAPKVDATSPHAENEQEAARIGVNAQCCATTATFLQEKEQPAWTALRGSRGFSSKSPEAMTSVAIAMGLVVLSFVLFALVYLFRSRWLRTGRKEKEAHGKKIAGHVAYGSISDSGRVLDASATL
ncbi:unnamed protein product [Amoebophrya sp. A25]|nr:unnamed protein product [Amoebophrya sp. A25]|eukprot:GSA25T00005508001.1